MERSKKQLVRFDLKRMKLFSTLRYFTKSSLLEKQRFARKTLSKEEKINSAKQLCWILSKNKANFEFNAAHCAKNLTQFQGKRQVNLVLLI